MSNLIATVIFYNDAELLEQSLKSIKDSGLDSIAIDGRFREFDKENKLYSTDGSIDVAKKYATKFIEADASFLKDQMSKRNRYIQEIADNNYFLVLDSDEKLCGGVVDTNLKETVYSIGLQEMSRPINTSSIRVHKKRDGLMYALRHCYLFLKSEMNQKAIDKWKIEFEKLKEDTPKELIKEALQGCITHQFEYDFLSNIEGDPMLIEHYQDKRSLDRQNMDLVYMSNRLEIQLNSCIGLPVIKCDGIEDDTRVVVKYFGKVVHNDCELGKVNHGDERVTNYKYAKKLQEDYSAYSFRIVKIIETKLTGTNKIINDKLDKILRILEN